MTNDETQYRTLTNPVLSGFYPDPSVCRVGCDFYLVNSTFAYFPGLPVFHSTDLIEWEQLCNAVDRPDQLDFSNTGVSRGLFAPTIRHNNGIFYIICTLIDKGGNFYITAENPAGPWSDPVWLEGADGIDPSLFFDDDGKVWYTGTRQVKNPLYFGDCEIWLRELDIKQKKLTGPEFSIWKGALRECVWPEGPHMYKIGRYYYLLIAEGGTGSDHAVTIARSLSPTGPWEGKKSNPIITHRHLGKNAAVTNVGHADLFDDGRGNWYMMLLASRPYGAAASYVTALPSGTSVPAGTPVPSDTQEPSGTSDSLGTRYANMGRETFLVTVAWEDGWPIVSPGSGLVEKTIQIPLAPAVLPPESAGAYDGAEDGFRTHSDPAGGGAERVEFSRTSLPLHFITLLRSAPYERYIDLSSKPGFLRLSSCGASPSSLSPLSFAGRRQQHFSWKASSRLFFDPGDEAESAGILVMQTEKNHIKFELCMTNGRRSVRAVSVENGIEKIIGQCVCPVSQHISHEGVDLIIECVYQSMSFICIPDGQPAVRVCAGADASILSPERSGSFTGTVIGLFCAGSSLNTSNFAEFEWFEYSKL